MNRKKLEIIILPVVLVLVFVYSICYNYRFGVALYNEAIEVAYQTETFANSIDFTRKEFEQSSSGADSVDTYSDEAEQAAQAQEDLNAALKKTPEGKQMLYNFIKEI